MSCEQKNLRGRGRNPAWPYKAGKGASWAVDPTNFQGKFLSHRFLIPLCLRMPEDCLDESCLDETGKTGKVPFSAIWEPFLAAFFFRYTER